MKRIFILFALMAVALTACESGDETTDAKEYVLTLASKSVMNFTAEGGKGEIGYALTESTRTAKPEYMNIKVECEVAWIEDITIEDSISFNVLPNDGSQRETVLKVSYETQSFSVMVRQEGAGQAADVEFRATNLNGTYFGKLQTYGYNYFIVLSDTGIPAMNDYVYGGTQYRFDLYADQTSAFEPVDYVPEGVYEFDVAGYGNPGTIDPTQSYYLNYGSEGNVSMDFASAKVTVTKDKIVAEVRMMNGKVHRITYEGSLALDYTQPTAADITASTQTSDVSFDVTGGTIMAYYRGDYYGKGADVWFLHMIEQKAGFSGVYLMMDLLVDKSEGGYENKEAFVGEYTVLNSEMDNFADTFAPGCLRDDWNQLHTWYMNCINSQIDPTNWAPFVDGKITVTKDGDGYVLTMDGKDDIGNKIQGTFRGVVGDYQNQAYDLE